MRDIKFRAWDKTRRVFIEVPSLHEMLFGYGNTYDYTDGSDIEFSQYAGLKDKNGTEIYEGDIVSLNFFESYDNDCLYVDDLDGEILVRVQFKNGGWFCSQDDSSWFHLHDVDDYCEIEIKGNIYENPDLSAS